MSIIANIDGHKSSAQRSTPRSISAESDRLPWTYRMRHAGICHDRYLELRRELDRRGHARANTHCKSNGARMGTPCQIALEQIEAPMLPPKEALADANERRLFLFYVALTRAKRQVVLFAHDRYPSPYALDLLRDHRDGRVLLNGAKTNSARRAHARARLKYQPDPPCFRTLADDETRARAAQDAIDEIAGFGMRAMGQPAAVIADLVTELEAVDVMHDVFAGRDVEALEVRHRVLAVLSQLHDAAEASEQRAAELKVQQDQLDAQRKDQAARQALLDKAEQEAKDKREAEEQARCERAEAIEVRIAAFGSLAADSAACSSIVLRDRLLMIERSAFTADLYGDRVAEARSAAEDTAKELSELLEAALLREQEAATAERQAQEALERETRAAALAAKVREVSGAMHNVLRQWKHAEVAKDKVELANAKVNRDALLAQLEG